MKRFLPPEDFKYCAQQRGVMDDWDVFDKNARYGKDEPAVAVMADAKVQAASAAKSKTNPPSKRAISKGRNTADLLNQEQQKIQKEVLEMQFKQQNPLVIVPNVSVEDLRKLRLKGSGVFGGKGVVVDTDRKLFVAVLDGATRQNSAK